MKIKELKNLDLTLYSEKLNNGLEIYIIPKDNVLNTYATYTTRYGGMHNEFIPAGEKNMISVPKGIAHFLEHKMFEQENGEDVFSFFSKNGSDANANTNGKRTSYLFSGPDNFYENLEFLLSYVEHPFFTNENVKKEKGIILEEIRMYQDRPYSRMINGILYNTFINHPLKYPTIGTEDSVNSITKEDLYKCYNTFYHPSNMFLVITGNVDPKKTIELIRKHEETRKLKKNKKIVLKEYEEPNNVAIGEEVIKMDITIPKTAIAFKIDTRNYVYDFDTVYTSIVNSFDLRLSTTSIFNERLRNEGLITGTIDVTPIKADKHIIVIVSAETNYPEKVIEEIKKEVKDLTITEIELERRKRVGISEMIFSSDNIYKMNNIITSNLLYLNKIEYDPVGYIRNHSYKTTIDILSNMNLDNYTIFTVLPLDKK